MHKTLALILKKQNIGETDRILTIFTPSFGKKRVIVRAVRKPLSRMAGHLDTFMLSQLILTEEADLPKVTSAVLIESFEGLRSSYLNMERAFAISKIVERVILENVSQQSIFQLTVDALARLNDDGDWMHVWLSFLSTLLLKLGLTLTDFKCDRCGKPLQGQSYWSPQDRSFSCEACGRPSGEVVRLQLNSIKLISLLQKKSYLTICTINIPNSVACEVEEVFLREITQWFNKPWLSYTALSRNER